MLNKKKLLIALSAFTFLILMVACLIFINHKKLDVIGEDETIFVPEYDGKLDSGNFIPVPESEGKKVTATFISTELSYIEYESISCYIKSNENSCEITLPIYNIEGSYTFFWSTKKLPETDLENYKWNSEYFYGVGSIYKLTENKIFYPNTNAFHSDWVNEESENYRPYYKYRKFDIIKSEKIGNTIFEFEKGIPENYINQYISQMKQIYVDIPWIFVPAKVFALTEKTYSSYSIAYGLTQNFYYQDYEPWTASVSAIDVQYDTTGIISEEIAPNSIALNATIHELAHAWDAYYRFCNREDSNAKLISETMDVGELYNSVKNSGRLFRDNNGYISQLEFFAGMVTNYYWHVLQKGPNKPYYALQTGKELTTDQKVNLKKIIETYAIKTSSDNN